MKALPVSIIRPHYHDASNGGISAVYDDVLVPCEDGPYDIDPTSAKNLMKLRAEMPLDRPLYKLVPYNEPDGSGPMFGGCFAFTSDSRFRRLLQALADKSYLFGDVPALFAVPIFDRYE